MSIASTQTQPDRAEDDATRTEEVVLWDPLLRLFHWLLVLAVATTWLLGKFGPDIMTLHFYGGYTVLGLLAFRLVWGIVGPRPARFTSFLYGPKTFIGYLRHLFARRPSYWRGHNPLGALAALGLLLLLAAQACLGLFADPEDYINVGPLASNVSAATSRAALAWHDRLSTLVLLLVILHVAAILFYKIWKRENLVRPMVTGRKKVRVERAR